MDEKTRRGRVGSTGSRERQREGRRELREEEGKNAEASIAGKARQDRTGQGTVNAGPRGLPSERQEAAATNQTGGMERTKRVVELVEESLERSRASVAEATWLRSCFIYLRPVASSRRR